MTRSQALAALRRAWIPALLAAGLTLALVLGTLMRQDPTYQARVGVVAAPAAGTDQNDPEYGSVVSLGMPALPELAVSTPVLERIAARFPRVTEKVLATSVAVELVPASGVARVTAKGDSPQLASTMLAAVVEQIVNSDLLAPVGQFRVLGDVDARPTKVRPDSRLAIGLGLLAAALVGLLAVAAVHVASPRLLTLADVERVVRSTLHEPVPVMALGRRQRQLGLLATQLAVTAPHARRVLVFPSGTPEEEPLARAMSEWLRQRAAYKTAGNMHAADNGGGVITDTGKLGEEVPALSADAAGLRGSDAALVTARLRHTRPEELMAALLDAREAGHEVSLVVAT